MLLQEAIMALILSMVLSLIIIAVQLQVMHSFLIIEHRQWLYHLMQEVRLAIQHHQTGWLDAWRKKVARILPQGFSVVDCEYQVCHVQIHYQNGGVEQIERQTWPIPP